MSTVQTGKVRVLPKEPVKPTVFSPRVLLIYGMPKVGKTEILSHLPKSLTLDFEGGTEMYEMVKERVYGVPDVFDIIRSIISEGEANVKEGKKGDDIFPYQFLAVDTIDMLEELCVESATRKYKASQLGKEFKGSTILELAHGGGYYYLREEVKLVLTELAKVCKHLVLISHVSDQNITKDGILVNSKDITMTGKLKVIVPSLCDAIGYLYRKPSKTPGAKDELRINFRTSEDSTMGSRFEYLAGKDMVFDWAKIFPNTLAV